MTKTYRTSSVHTLEAESVYIFREVVATFERPALLFSGDADSMVLLRIAAKAFWPADPPFPMLHLETGHDSAELTLLRAIRAAEFDGVFDGARRDEQNSHANEVFSSRDEFGQWDPRHRSVEPWNLYHGAHRRGDHVRVFPLANWTEPDIRCYLAAEDIELPSFADDSGEEGCR